jgi:hypothetical protein
MFLLLLFFEGYSCNDTTKAQFSLPGMKDIGHIV